MRPANKTDCLKKGRETAKGEKGIKNGGLKILLYDVETSPNIAYIWGKYECDALGEFVRERQVISVAWKWLGEKDVHVFAMPMLKSYKKSPENNKELIIFLHSLMQDADVVVGHNVSSFDDPMSNTEFIVHGLMPPPPHKIVDTLSFARHKFRFNSNKLGDLGKRLGLGEKVHTGGFELWAGCLRGDKASWKRMMEYNIGDVVLLEKIYLKMRPWMTAHPDMNAIDSHVGCPACKGKNLVRRGWGFSSSGKKMRFRCKDCGKWSKGALVRREWKFK